MPSDIRMYTTTKVVHNLRLVRLHLITVVISTEHNYITPKRVQKYITPYM